jgi:hypothetical protein
MSSEKRTIKINPELFKVSDKNNSRRKKISNELIKVKTEQKVKNKTLRRSVMKMIRDKQQDEYKKLFSNKERKEKSPDMIENLKFNKDFENSIDYFNSLVEKEKDQKINNTHNNTIKRYPERPISYNMYENVSMELPDVFNNVNPIISTPSLKIHTVPKNMILPAPPKYGCLKNGILPTYRNFHNITRRTNPLSKNENILSLSTPVSQDNNNEILSNATKNDISEKRQKFQKGELIKSGKKRIKYLKRRKIYKRTFKIGRSQTKPQISVLVSNKTIRNRISTDAQLLKQTPIHDVKLFLIKKGFIKVGTTTPNDVLRKMYESVSLICGEIQNHNPENLLYNFIVVVTSTS